MKNYYFAALALPDLNFERQPEISSNDLEFILKLNLTPNDYAKTLVIQSLYENNHLSNYFNHEINQADGFLKKYLQFERDWRLVFTGFRAKHLGKDLQLELQHEDPDDELIAQILAQKDHKTFEPPDSYTNLKDIFNEHYKNPMELHKALNAYRFNMIESFCELDPFSIDRILGYLAQYLIVKNQIF